MRRIIVPLLLGVGVVVACGRESHDNPCPAVPSGASGVGGSSDAGNDANDSGGAGAGTAGEAGAGAAGEAGASACSQTTDVALSGLQIFPADNPWNQDVSAVAVSAQSDAYINALGASDSLGADFGPFSGLPYNVVAPGTPPSSPAFDFPDDSDTGGYPIPANPLLEMATAKRLLLIDPIGKTLYELSSARSVAAGWAAGRGAIFDLTSNALRPDSWASADSAGLPIFPGLVRYDEAVVRGQIQHALRFTAAAVGPGHISPARHGATTSSDPTLPPLGLRLRLKASVAITSFSPHVQVILRALQHYGMFLADTGANLRLSGAPHECWDESELLELTQITAGQLEALDTGPVTP